MNDQNEMSDQVPELEPVNRDRTPLAIVTLLTTGTVILAICGLARLAGLDALAAMTVAAAANTLAFLITFALTVASRKPVLPLLVMMATAATLSGICWTIFRTSELGYPLFAGMAVMLAAALTSLFKNIDEHVPFVPFIVGMMVTMMFVMFLIPVLA